VQVPQVIDERVEELIEKLLAEGIIISDRRDVRIDPLIQAHALMEGRNQVNETDLTILQHCFWSQPSEIKTVQRVVLSISNPMENKAIELLDQATEIRDNAVQAANGSAGGKLIKINGPASLPVAMAIAHAIAHLYEVVGVFDPKLGKYVVAVSHGNEYRPGDLID